MQADVQRSTGKAPAEAHPADEALSVWMDALASSAQSLLLLDFDGTLAPFRKDPASVKPWAGVPRLIDAIRATSRSRVVLISGRPARDVATHLGLSMPVEVWGLHGAERLGLDGLIEAETLPLRKKTLLAAARAALENAGALPASAHEPGLRIETKWNAVAGHWRGLSPQASPAAAEKARSILQPFAQQGELELLSFDGGMELRAGRHKGDAVRHLLAEIAPAAPAAYLGDDITDEDAFAAMQGRGLSILVRRAWRPTVAELWMRPPQGLRSFLKAWLAAVRR